MRGEELKRDFVIRRDLEQARLKSGRKQDKDILFRGGKVIRL